MPEDCIRKYLVCHRHQDDLSAAWGAGHRQYVAGGVRGRGRYDPGGSECDPRPVREKVIGANRNGIKKIFIPRQNEKDLEDIPNEIKDGMQFILVDRYMDIYKQLFKIKRRTMGLRRSFIVN